MRQHKHMFALNNRITGDAEARSQTAHYSLLFLHQNDIPTAFRQDLLVHPRARSEIMSIVDEGAHLNAAPLITV